MIMNVKNAYEKIAKDYDGQYDNNLFWRISDDLTIRYMLKLMPSKGKVIDIGCGTGEYGLSFIKLGYEVDFSDLASNMLDVVQKKADKYDLKYCPKYIALDLCEKDFQLPDKYNVIIAEGDVLGYCLDKDIEVIDRLAKYLTDDGIIFIGVDNMILNVINLAEKGDLDGIDRFFDSFKTTCPMNLPIKQYSIREFEKILPPYMHIETIIGKPIITPYLSRTKKNEIIRDHNKYDQLLKLEEKAILQGYSTLGSHFTFAIKKNVSRI